jgi:hypothetical protein
LHDAAAFARDVLPLHLDAPRPLPGLFRLRDSNVIPIDEIRVGTAPDNSGAILHLTTADSIPVAVEVPAALGDVVEQLQRVVATLDGVTRAKKRLHLLRAKFGAAQGQPN